MRWHLLRRPACHSPGRVLKDDCSVKEVTELQLTRARIRRE